MVPKLAFWCIYALICIQQGFGKELVDNIGWHIDFDDPSLLADNVTDPVERFQTLCQQFGVEPAMSESIAYAARDSRQWEDIMERLQTDSRPIHIAVFGGSVTTGAQCKQNDPMLKKQIGKNGYWKNATQALVNMHCAWPMKLERLFRAIFGGDVFVYNFSKGGMSTYEALHHVLEVLNTHDHKMDMVIYHYTTNDETLATKDRDLAQKTEELIRSVNLIPRFESKPPVHMFFDGLGCYMADKRRGSTLTVQEHATWVHTNKVAPVYDTTVVSMLDVLLHTPPFDEYIPSMVVNNYGVHTPRSFHEVYACAVMGVLMPNKSHVEEAPIDSPRPPVTFNGPGVIIHRLTDYTGLLSPLVEGEEAALEAEQKFEQSANYTGLWRFCRDLATKPKGWLIGAPCVDTESDAAITANTGASQSVLKFPVHCEGFCFVQIGYLKSYGPEWGDVSIVVSAPSLKFRDETRLSGVWADKESKISVLQHYDVQIMDETLTAEPTGDPKLDKKATWSLKSNSPLRKPLTVDVTITMKKPYKKFKILSLSSFGTEVEHVGAASNVMSTNETTSTPL